MECLRIPPWSVHIPTGTPTGNTHEESSWGSQISMCNTRGNPMVILTGYGESPWGQDYSRWGSLKHDQGRAELSHGRFLLDPGISAWVEQALDTAENCSTPCPRPGIRPRRFCLGRIPGLRPGVEQVLARMVDWLDPRRNAWVEIPPDPEILAGGYAIMANNSHLHHFGIVG